MDAWVLAACEGFKVNSVDIVNGGYLITVSPEVGSLLFPWLNGWIQALTMKGWLTMDSTHSLHQMEKTEKTDTLKTFSNLPKAVRTAFAAGAAFGHLRAQLEEDKQSEGKPSATTF